MVLERLTKLSQKGGVLPGLDHLQDVVEKVALNPIKLHSRIRLSVAKPTVYPSTPPTVDCCENTCHLENDQNPQLAASLDFQASGPLRTWLTWSCSVNPLPGSNNWWQKRGSILQIG